MSQEPPTLEYAKADAPSKPCLRWWPSVISIVLIVLFVPMFIRPDGGHLGLDGFIATVPAFGFACYGWIGNKHRNLLWRGVLILVVGLASLPLFMNVTDVLWLGYGAILR